MKYPVILLMVGIGSIAAISVSYFVSNKSIETVEQYNESVSVDEEKSPEAESQESVVWSAKAQSDYEQILNSQLFKGSNNKISKKVESGDLKISELPLKLIGTIANEENSGSGVAVILHTEKKLVESFEAGEAIHSMGATIKEIYPLKVHLEVNGNIEVLVIDKSGITADSKKVVVNQPQTSRDSALSLNNLKDWGFERRDQRVKITKEAKKNIIGHLGDILTSARVVPNMVESEVSGFVFQMMKEDSIFKHFGFAKGDIVHAINGVEIESVSQGIRVLNTLRKEENFAVELERDGSRMTIEVEVI